MKAIIFDTETTALLDNRSMNIDKLPECIEFFGQVVDLADGAIESELSLLIKPSKPVPEEVTRITRIDDIMLADQPSFRAVAPQIEQFFAAGPPVVIAHNLSYDQEVIEIEFQRLGRAFQWPPRMICTVEATVFYKGFRLNLTGLHEHLFGEGFPEAHRAAQDVKALTRCAVELYRRGDI